MCTVVIRNHFSLGMINGKIKGKKMLLLYQGRKMPLKVLKKNLGKLLLKNQVGLLIKWLKNPSDSEFIESTFLFRKRPQIRSKRGKSYRRERETLLLQPRTVQRVSVMYQIEHTLESLKRDGVSLQKSLVQRYFVSKRYEDECQEEIVQRYCVSKTCMSKV